MNTGSKTPPPKVHNSPHSPRRLPTQAQPHKPSFAPSKMAAASTAKQSPQLPTIPPTVQRPRLAPKVLQPKLAVPHQPVDLQKRAPVAPPVYCPQSKPKVLQTKMAAAQQSGVGGAGRIARTPQGFHPAQKKIVQPKLAATAQTRTAPKASPPHRFQPGTLQPKHQPRAHTTVQLKQHGASRVIQRSALTQVKRVQLSGDYLELLIRLAKYCPDFVRSHHVEENLMIGQSIGLAEPEHWGHASETSGSGGESERAKKNQELYTKWYNANKSALAGYELAEGGSSSGSSSLKHNQQQQAMAAIQKEEKKENKLANKHRQWHEQKGTQLSKTCKECKTHGLA